MEVSAIKQTGSRSPWISLAGFLVYYASLALLIAHGLNSGILHWPFHAAGTLSGTYLKVALYLPLAFVAAGTLFFLKSAGISIRDRLSWTRFSHTFTLGMLVSIGYSIYLFAGTRFDLREIYFWPPIILLSLLNAFAEETAYRLVFFRLLRATIKEPLFCNLLQAGLYALPHLWIGGIRMLFSAFFYGLLLGLMTEKNRSVTPAFICHFCIDIGNIGLPLLIVLPV